MIFPVEAGLKQKQVERLQLTAANVYSGAYNLTRAGAYVVSVVLDTCAQTSACDPAFVSSSHIRHSPFVLKIVAGQTSPWNSDIDGGCTRRAHAQQACSMTLTLRDAYSNARTTGGDDVRASLQGPLAVPDRAGYGPKATSIRVYIQDNKDGTFGVTYMATIVGRYSLAVSVEGSDISLSPFMLYVQGGFKLASMTDDEPEFAHPNGSLWLLGDAHISSSRTNAPQGLHLSSRPPSPQSVGSAWFRRPQRLTSGFVMDLSIQITPLTPACKNWRGRDEGGTEEWCVLRGGEMQFKQLDGEKYE